MTSARCHSNTSIELLPEARINRYRPSIIWAAPHLPLKRFRQIQPPYQPFVETTRIGRFNLQCGILRFHTNMTSHPHRLEGATRLRARMCSYNSDELRARSLFFSVQGSRSAITQFHRSSATTPNSGLGQWWPGGEGQHSEDDLDAKELAPWHMARWLPFYEGNHIVSLCAPAEACQEVRSRRLSHRSAT